MVRASTTDTASAAASEPRCAPTVHTVSRPPHSQSAYCSPGRAPVRRRGELGVADGGNGHHRPYRLLNAQPGEQGQASKVARAILSANNRKRLKT